MNCYIAKLPYIKTKRSPNFLAGWSFRLPTNRRRGGLKAGQAKSGRAGPRSENRGKRTAGRAVGPLAGAPRRRGLCADGGQQGRGERPACVPLDQSAERGRVHPARGSSRKTSAPTILFCQAWRCVKRQGRNKADWQNKTVTALVRFAGFVDGRRSGLRRRGFGRRGLGFGEGFDALA